MDSEVGRKVKKTREWWYEQIWEMTRKRLTRHRLYFTLRGVKSYLSSPLTCSVALITLLHLSHPPCGAESCSGAHQKVPVTARARDRILGRRSTAKHWWAVGSQGILTGHRAVGSAVTVNTNSCQVTRVPGEGLHWRPLLPAAEFDAGCCDPTEQEQEHSQQD